MLSQTNSHTPSEGDAGANGKTLCEGNTTTKRERTASFPHQGHSAPDRKKYFSQLDNRHTFINKS